MAKAQRKVLISAAITGGVHTPTMSPYLPSNAEQIIQNAVDAYKAGASIVHIHARLENGQPTADYDTFEKILTGIKKQCNVVIGITTGGAQGMTTQERFDVIERFKPEMASANGGSMNFCFSRLADGVDFEHDWEKPFITRTWDNVFKNTFMDIEYCVKTMNACGTRPEFEVFDYGQLKNLEYFLKKGVIEKPVYLQFVPGIMGGMPISNEGMMFMIDQAKKLLGDDIQYSTVAPGRRMFRLSAMMALQGGNVRVGMEDGLYLKPDGTLAKSNAEQVEKVRRILEDLDYPVGTPDDAREQLQLKGIDKVEF
ncbi:MAG: 3-keto-5-aminohexanoate cleavage protein [Eubacteriales bacterium]|nr:3-keto-5-aminohexanoate cleavage protein [Eubacteriales bacterium]